MIPSILVLISWMVFRALGALGLSFLESWQDSARYALALMFLFTASAHFTRMKEDLVKMVPPAFPQPCMLVFVTGVLEIVGAIGLLIPAFKAFAAMGLIALMSAMFPANIYAARHQVLLRGKPPTPLWLRLPMQIVFIALTWWSTQPWPISNAEGFR